jgi:hypothetical protein
MNLTDLSENLESAGTGSFPSLIRQWRQMWNLIIRVPENNTLENLVFRSTQKMRSLVIISDENNVLVGVMPLLYDDKTAGEAWLSGLLQHTTYRVTHLNDSATIFKFLKAWNKA